MRVEKIEKTRITQLLLALENVLASICIFSGEFDQKLLLLTNPSKDLTKVAGSLANFQSTELVSKQMVQ